LYEICHDHHDDASSLQRYQPKQKRPAKLGYSRKDVCRQFGVCGLGLPGLDELAGDFGHAGHQTMMFLRCLPGQVSCDSCLRENLDDASLGHFGHLCALADRRLVTMLRLCLR
jgi:hypothetical protein